MKKVLIPFLALVFLLSGSVIAYADTGSFSPFVIQDNGQSQKWNAGLYKRQDSGWENKAYITITYNNVVSGDTCQLRVRDNQSNYATNYISVTSNKKYTTSYLSDALARKTTLYYLWGSCTSENFTYVSVAGQWTP